MLSEINSELFLTEPLLFQILCTHASKANSSMTVAFRSGHQTIEYNPTILSTMKKPEIVSLYKRELIRILLKHPYQRKPEPFIGDLAYFASNLTIEQDAKLLKQLNMPPQQHFEFYYYHMLDQQPASAGIAGLAELSQQAEENSSQQDSLNASSGAGLWDEDSLAVENINTLLSTWISAGKHWGTIPQNLKDLIIASMTTRIDYRKVLHSFRASIISDKRMLTRNKPSRRYGFDYMGSKFDFTTRLLLAVDTSGSVTDKQLADFFGVINRIFKYGIKEIEVLYFDCAIADEPKLFRKAQKKFLVTGRGGTNFQVVFDYVAKHPGYDGCIIFTDGEAPEPQLVPHTKTRFAWVCSTEDEYNAHHHWMEHTGKACFLKS